MRKNSNIQDISENNSFFSNLRFRMTTIFEKRILNYVAILIKHVSRTDPKSAPSFSAPAPALAIL